jgi:hypothetical protein
MTRLLADLDRQLLLRVARASASRRPIAGGRHTAEYSSRYTSQTRSEGVWVMSRVKGRWSRPDAIEIGRHGLVIDDGPRRGLLLPQVAVERGWDAQTFVSKTCVKAGLRPDAWTHTVTLSMFEADVFSEVDATASGSEGP